MWWEILPSMTIITVAMGIPALATRAINRAIHDGNPCKRNYTQSEPHGVLYHYRDTQHSKPSFWQTYIKVGLGRPDRTQCSILTFSISGGLARKRNSLQEQHPR